MSKHHHSAAPARVPLAVGDRAVNLAGEFRQGGNSRLSSITGSPVPGSEVRRGTWPPHPDCDCGSRCC